MLILLKFHYCSRISRLLGVFFFSWNKLSVRVYQLEISIYIYFVLYIYIFKLNQLGGKSLVKKMKFLIIFLCKIAKVTTGYPITREKVTVSDWRALIGNCVLSLKACRKLCGYLIKLNFFSTRLSHGGEAHRFLKFWPSHK